MLTIEKYPSATVACFDPTRGELPRRHLDPERLSAFLRRLSDAGAPAVLIGASTGHGHLRTSVELEEFFRCAAVGNLGPMVKMALLRPEDGLKVNSHLLQLLKELAYDVVFFRPGTDLPTDASVERIAASLQPLIQEVSEMQLAVGLYSISDVSGFPLTTDVVAKLVEAPGGGAVVAVKVTEENYETSTLAFLKDTRLKHLKIVQGWDPHLGRALRDGPVYSNQASSPSNATQRCGVTSGPMSLAIYQYLHILASAEAEDWLEVDRAQAAVTALFSSMQDDPRKFADLQRAKYVMGLGHPMLGEVSEPQLRAIFEALSSLPRQSDRKRLALSLDLMGDGPYHQELLQIAGS